MHIRYLRFTGDWVFAEFSSEFGSRLFVPELAQRPPGVGMLVGSTLPEFQKCCDEDEV